MGYMEIVNIIMIAVGVIAVIFPLQYAFLFVAGVFAKQKTYPPAEQKLRYGVIVCARNEERVIRQLVESIRKCDYPQDKLDIFVIAHNCTDGTAAAAQTGGAFVYEYSNPQERTKGYALRQIFRYIERDFGIRQYDGFHVLLQPALYQSRPPDGRYAQRGPCIREPRISAADPGECR